MLRFLARTLGAFGLWVGGRLLNATWRLLCWGFHHLLSRLRGRSTTHGSAAWATSKHLTSANALGTAGLIAGKVGRRFIRFAQPEGSMIVFAPQGAGKGVGIVVPNLLEYPGSVIVTDPKGENFAVTARQRRTFGPVRAINLIDPTQSAQFNPLAYIRIGTWEEDDDAERLADLLLMPDAKADQHWRDKAKSWLAGFLLYVAYVGKINPAWGTMGNVHRIVCSDADRLKQIMEQMLVMPVERVRNTAQQILRDIDKTEEARNILSHIMKGTEPWSFGKAMGELSRGHDIDLGSFQRETQSLYLVVPEDNPGITITADKIVLQTFEPRDDNASA